ncbi:MAG: NapC/NirT family cytochrome c [Anaerolineales bacterium]|nr:NapC/NirT family cytochrome c [Anaerolineales bacterium]
MVKRFKQATRNFFFPPAGSPRWVTILPYAILGLLAIGLVVGGTYGWEYTNSPTFCGTACHTMPPQDVTYLLSPHANVYCSECHIGRASLGEQLRRKSEDVRELTAMVFQTYEFPIRATRSRPAQVTCERCHAPQTFSDDSLRVITHFGNDNGNTQADTYLIMHTGGGSAREGLGRGIHWHIENPVYYYANDLARQEIPYVRVVNNDGTSTEYIDIESDFDPATLDESQLIEMDCITCHNRVTHAFLTPEESVDRALTLGLIDAGIPQIRRQALRVLKAGYESRAAAMEGIASLTDYYRQNLPEFFAGNQEQLAAAVIVVQEIYDRSVFHDQQVDWTTHPNNLGHITAPGCFRCHDGTHLNLDQEAIRLECNLCHSIPVVAGEGDFVATIEISRGPEPGSHLNPNWIALHNAVFDATCSNCHTTGDPGGTSNTSFCSNSACHGSAYTYAAFDAPALRETLRDQLPPPSPEPTLAAVVGTPTFAANVGPLFSLRCAACHNPAAPNAGLDLSTHSGAVAGGDDGPVILAGNPDASLLVQVQRGSHFVNLSPEELDIVIQWILAGAPEQ